MIDTLREINRHWPESQIETSAGDIDYTFEDDTLVIITPDRSSDSRSTIEALRAAGLSGIWRTRKRSTT